MEDNIKPTTDNKYADIEALTQRQSEMLDNALQQQRNIINQQTQMNVDELNRNKDKVDVDTNKTNKALYSDYRKATNPYGVNAENLASKGLGNSGYAETTQTNLYNTYQKNITDTLDNARSLKADFDFQIAKARQTGDLALAQSALDIYKQKMQLLSNEYDLKNNKDQFLYQQQRDQVADNQWQQEFDRQQNQWQQNFDYQKSRDQVADNQWQQNFDYQKGRDTVADNQWQQKFDYQKGRDAVSDNQWQQSFDYQKNRDNVADSQWRTTFDYQRSRDAVADNQWQQQFALSKANASRRSSS